MPYCIERARVDEAIAFMIRSFFFLTHILVHDRIIAIARLTCSPRPIGHRFFSEELIDTVGAMGHTAASTQQVQASQRDSGDGYSDDARTSNLRVQQQCSTEVDNNSSMLMLNGVRDLHTRGSRRAEDGTKAKYPAPQTRRDPKSKREDPRLQNAAPYVAGRHLFICAEYNSTASAE